MGLREDLVERIEADDVVWIVGTGVSVGATGNAPVASWAGLLHHGLDRARELGRLSEKAALPFHEHLRSDDLDLLLATAELVATKLGAPRDGEWSRWLRETVGGLEVRNPDVLEALRDLGGVLATTNYDDLIEDVTGLPAVPWCDGGQVERVLRPDAKGVLHLHGHWARPESVILGFRDYARLLENAHAKAMLQAIRSFRTLVFVGCGDGLQDPNFGALLRWSEQAFAGSEYRHYRLARTGEAEAVQKQHPDAQRIVALDYGPRFEDLGPFLRSLQPARAGRAARAPKAAAAPAAGPALLPPAPQCFGRETETTQLLDALCKREPVVVLGPPGIGKSTVTLVALNDPAMAAAYGARRFFVRCESARSRADLAVAIATAIGCQVGPHLEAAILAELRTAPAALTLDNLETPWEADVLGVEELLEQLAAIPGLALAASLRGLSRPHRVRWCAVEPKSLGPDDARKAFLAIAGGAFAKDPHLDELLRVLDFVPLAVTLMAGAAQGEPDLLGTWRRWQAERTAMLQRGTADARLLSIEVSYEISLTGPRMTEKARRLLGVLSLFPAGIAREDLDAVFRNGHAPANLLRQVGLAFDEGGRIRLLAPLREYVGRAHAPSKRDRRAAVSHYLELAERLGDKAGAAGGAEAIATLTPEAGNIERAISIAASGGDLARACAASGAFAEFSRFSGVGSSAPILEAAEAARRQGHELGAALCYQGLAQVALARSDLQTARSYLDEAHALFRRVRNTEGEARCVENLGEVALRSGNLEAAQSHFDEALRLYAQSGSTQGRANCIQRLAQIADDRLDAPVARARFEEALALYRDVKDVLGEAYCILRLADMARDARDVGSARARYDEVLPLFRMVGDFQGEANCMMRLGELALERDDVGEARRLIQEALRLYTQVADLLGQANCVHLLARVALGESDPDAARSGFERALRMYEQLGHSYSIGWSRFRLAQIARSATERAGHVAAARKAWERIGRADLIEKLIAEFGAEPIEA